MRKIFIIIALISSFTANSQTIRVAAAGNLRYILEDIKARYLENNPKSKIEITIGASGALTQQIMNGAAFDFFMAADTRFPQKLKEMACTSGNIKTYAYGKLAIWSNTLDVSRGIDILKDSRVNRIAIAKPQIAPYGEKAVQCMKYYKVYESSKSKLVYADNIAQAAQFAETGNAQVALIAYALVFGPEMKNKGNFYLLDSKSYKPVEQACVLLKRGAKNQEAIKFMNFVLSSECKPIFVKYGFDVP